MTYEERSRVRRFSRVCKFGAAYRHLFPETSAAAVSFATIKAELPQLEALDLAERLASHNARTARAAEARKRLLDCLARASRTAEALARTIPQLAALAKRPGKMADHMLLSIARQFLEAISAHAGVFATHGIAVATIEEPLELFALAVNERGVRRGEKVEARASINPSMARALEALAVLDVTVPNHLADDPATLAVWKRERSLKRHGRKKDAAGEPEEGQPAQGVSEMAVAGETKTAA